MWRTGATEHERPRGARSRSATTNRFTPAPDDRGQPTTFEQDGRRPCSETTFEASSGAHVDAVGQDGDGVAELAGAATPTVELGRSSVPADDPGVFQLRINGAIVATGGNGTTSGPLRSGIGEGTASETAAPGTNLADYDSRVECTRNGTVDISVPGTKVDGKVAPRRRRRLHVHEHAQGHASRAPDTAHAADPTDATHPPTPPTPPDAAARLRRRPRAACPPPSTSSSPRPSRRRPSSSAAG